jgi:hypothetical protein
LLPSGWQLPICQLVYGPWLTGVAGQCGVAVVKEASRAMLTIATSSAGIQQYGPQHP